MRKIRYLVPRYLVQKCIGAKNKANAFRAALMKRKALPAASSVRGGFTFSRLIAERVEMAKPAFAIPKKGRVQPGRYHAAPPPPFNAKDLLDQQENGVEEGERGGDAGYGGWRRRRRREEEEEEEEVRGAALSKRRSRR